MKEQIRSIQGLRAFAFLLIFTSHVFSQFKAAGGWGVSIFLIISGFLAAYSEYDGVCGYTLLKSRLRKTYSLHVLTLLISLPLCYKLFLQSDGTGFVIGFIINLLLLQAWIPKASVYFSFNAVSWYLSVFMFLSLITPALLRRVKSWTIKNEYIIAICVIAEILWYLAVRNLSCDVHWLTYIFPIARSIDFIIGICMFGYMKNIEIAERESNTLLFLSLLAGTCLLGMSRGSEDEAYSVIAWTIPSICLVGAVVGGDRVSNYVSMLFANSVMLGIGEISLELFLIHQLIIRYVLVVLHKLDMKAPCGIVYLFVLSCSIIFALMFKSMMQYITREKGDR